MFIYLFLCVCVYLLILFVCLFAVCLFLLLMLLLLSLPVLVLVLVGAGAGALNLKPSALHRRLKTFDLPAGPQAFPTRPIRGRKRAPGCFVGLQGETYSFCQLVGKAT